jgi:hypothetical protein
MPYRRLPNTDKARIRSLATAVDKMKNSYYYAPVLSPELFNRAEKKLQQFREVVDRYLAAQKRQVSNSKSDIYQTRLKNARMYVSHFLTVFNLCVKRGEMTDFSIPLTRITGNCPICQVISRLSDAAKMP